MPDWGSFDADPIADVREALERGFFQRTVPIVLPGHARVTMHELDCDLDEDCRCQVFDTELLEWNDLPDAIATKEEGMSEFAGYAVGGVDLKSERPDGPGMGPLEQQIDLLSERIEYLGHRLRPVLMPERPSDMLEQVRGMESDFGAQVQRLRDLERRVSELIERLDI